jgi:hypothetical protein
VNDPTDIVKQFSQKFNAAKKYFVSENTKQFLTKKLYEELEKTQNMHDVILDLYKKYTEKSKAIFSFEKEINKTLKSYLDKDKERVLTKFDTKRAIENTLDQELSDRMSKYLIIYVIGAGPSSMVNCIENIVKGAGIVGAVWSIYSGYLKWINIEGQKGNLFDYIKAKTSANKTAIVLITSLLVLVPLCRHQYEQYICSKARSKILKSWEQYPSLDINDIKLKKFKFEIILGACEMYFKTHIENLWEGGLNDAHPHLGIPRFV